MPQGSPLTRDRSGRCTRTGNGQVEDEHVAKGPLLVMSCGDPHHHDRSRGQRREGAAHEGRDANPGVVHFDLGGFFLCLLNCPSSLVCFV